MREAVRVSSTARDTQPVRTLSGGNQQKVVLGKWLLADPRVLLLDEFCNGLDAGSRSALLGVVSTIARTGTPIVFATHRHDEIVPFAHGRALLDAAREPKQFLELRGGHNDGFVVSGRAYRDGLDAFLTAHVGK